jgi:hypothetical protein
MILARIEKPIRPFASANAAWGYVGNGNSWGMSDVDELNVFMLRVTPGSEGVIVTRPIWLYPISGARPAPEFEWINHRGGNQPAFLPDTYMSSVDGSWWACGCCCHADA